jgi:ATP-dependent Clp protease ATP-binding subunit ClpB
MTSNMGSQIIQEKFENLKEAWKKPEAAKEEVLALLKTVQNSSTA